MADSYKIKYLNNEDIEGFFSWKETMSKCKRHKGEGCD